MDSHGTNELADDVIVGQGGCLNDECSWRHVDAAVGTIRDCKCKAATGVFILCHVPWPRGR
jgi:hypothetical protein